MEDKFYCEALKEALLLEKEGKKFYEESLERVKNRFAREALNFLINEEERHIDTILRFNSSLLGKSDFDLEKECGVKADEKIKKLIELHVLDRVKKELKEAKTDIEVYEVAMDFEKRGYEFYRERAEKEENEKVKMFFEYLTQEEIKHYELLQQTIKYLSEPDYYFEDFGGWIFS